MKYFCNDLFKSIDAAAVFFYKGVHVHQLGVLDIVREKRVNDDRNGWYSVLKFPEKPGYADIGLIQIQDQKVNGFMTIEIINNFLAVSCQTHPVPTRRDLTL